MSSVQHQSNQSLATRLSEKQKEQHSSFIRSVLNSKNKSKGNELAASYPHSLERDEGASTLEDMEVEPKENDSNDGELN